MKSVRELMRLFSAAVCTLLLISVAMAEPTKEAEKSSESAIEAEMTPLEAIDAEIRSLMTAREAALLDLRLRYDEAEPEDRTAIEAEGAELNADYDRAYLELVVEYHRLTGNEVELQRAEAQLEVLDAGVATGEPLDLERGVTLEQTQTQRQTEGVLNDE